MGHEINDAIDFIIREISNAIPDKRIISLKMYGGQLSASVVFLDTSDFIYIKLPEKGYLNFLGELTQMTITELRELETVDVVTIGK